MNRLIPLLLFSLTLVPVFGQGAIDTLYANEREVLSVFFESPIQKAITGAPHFEFSYNREDGEKLGLLQATPGPTSNLLVLTESDGVYSFVLAFRDSLEEFTHFVDTLVRVNPNSTNKPVLKSRVPNSDEVAGICQQMLESKLTLHPQKKEHGIGLQVSEPFYHKDYTYIRYALQNSSAINYEIDTFTLYRVLGRSARKASLQILPLSPVFHFKLPVMVSQGTTEHFVLVYPKFTLGSHETLKVSLREHRGNRNITFKLRGL